MYRPPQLIRDGADRCKLAVTLPGGRYQLSLDDRAVNLLLDDLGLQMRDTVPAPFVPFFVAVGDAWFPRERDTDAIIDDLRSDGSLTPDERDALVAYVTEALVPERNVERVERVLDASPIADEVDPADLTVNSLPEIPEWADLGGSSDEPTQDASVPGPGSDEPVETVGTEHPEQPANAATDSSETSGGSEETDASAVEALQEIPGVGPTRAAALVEGGVTSLSEVADSRPVSLAAIDGITEEMGAVAVEGARELLGQEAPTHEQLAAETGTESDVFEPTLRSLAASGVPATEAAPTLRVLYGPTVADVEAVTGQQAYYLWEAGYRTPQDLVEATADELTDVYSIGEATAPDIKTSAVDCLDGTRQ